MWPVNCINKADTKKLKIFRAFQWVSRKFCSYILNHPQEGGDLCRERQHEMGRKNK